MAKLRTTLACHWYNWQNSERRTVGGQNQVFFFFFFFFFFKMSCQSKHGPQPKKKLRKFMLCSSKRNAVHGKLNKIESGCRFCRICLLGRLSAIIVDVLSDDVYIGQICILCTALLLLSTCNKMHRNCTRCSSVLLLKHNLLKCYKKCTNGFKPYTSFFFFFF